METVLLKFVYYYLKGNINILADGFRGTGLRHLSKEYFSNIEIPPAPNNSRAKSNCGKAGTTTHQTKQRKRSAG